MTDRRKRDPKGRILPVSGWRPIDSLPHDMGTVLVVNSAGCCAVVNMISADGIGYFNDDDGGHTRISCITHWMPLPKLPRRTA